MPTCTFYSIFVFSYFCLIDSEDFTMSLLSILDLEFVSYVYLPLAKFPLNILRSVHTITHSTAQEVVNV